MGNSCRRMKIRKHVHTCVGVSKLWKTPDGNGFGMDTLMNV